MSSFLERSREQIRTYERWNSVVFLKTDEPFGGLSNMAGGYPLNVQGIRIFSSEALYQACRFPHLPEVQRSIIAQHSPMTAKMKSKPFRKDSRADWDQVRVKVMRWCLRVKLAQNWAKFSDLLLRTGERSIVEESRKDDFWGAKAVDEDVLVGMNVLGRLLMELREAVKSHAHDDLLQVVPLNIPEFKLVGRQIVAVDGRALAPLDSAAAWSKIQNEALKSGQPSLFNKGVISDLALNQDLVDLGLTELPQYQALKNSGVQWLGQVPEHWEVVPALAVYRPRQVKNTGMQESTVLSLSYGRIVVKPEEKLRGLVPESFDTYQIVEPGNIIIRTTDLQNDQTSLRVGLSRDHGIITSAYLCLETTSHVSPQFGYEYLNAYDLVKVIYGYGSGLRQNLDFGDIKRMPVLVPPPTEQTAIVRFLDYMDRKIRQYIRAKQKLIKLLEEQKQVIIHRAVTLGLDPKDHLKASGVEWLGCVPACWEVLRIKQVASIIRGKFTHRPRNDPSLYDGPYPFIQTGEVARAKKSIKTYKQTLNERGLAVSKMFPAGTLVMTIAANIGDVAILDFEACFPDSVVGFVPRQGIERDYLYYVFRAMKPELLREAPVSTQGNLNVDRIGSRRIPIPSLPEQEGIVKQIEQNTFELTVAVDKAEHEIDLLREYRTRLIADVVTGKVDVTKIALRFPMETEDAELAEETDIDTTSDQNTGGDENQMAVAES